MLPFPSVLMLIALRDMCRLCTLNHASYQPQINSQTYKTCNNNNNTSSPRTCFAFSPLHLARDVFVSSSFNFFFFYYFIFYIYFGNDGGILSRFHISTVEEVLQYAQGAKVFTHSRFKIQMIFSQKKIYNTIHHIRTTKNKAQ